MFYIERRENEECAASCKTEFRDSRQQACCKTKCGRLYCDKPKSPVKVKGDSGTIQDKSGTARLRKGQETEFRIDPGSSARVIHIDVAKFETPKNETTTLELYEGYGTLSKRLLVKWSNQNRPEKSTYTVYLGAATLSGV